MDGSDPADRRLTGLCPVRADGPRCPTRGRNQDWHLADEFHRKLDVDEIRNKRQELGTDQLDEAPWPVHFEQTIRDRSFATEEQDVIAKRIYDDWVRESRTSTTVAVVHDDLHTENLLFRDQALVGILDFGCTTIGCPEQDLRHTFWMSDRIADSAIMAYEQCSGLRLNADLVRLWSIMQELAAHSEYTDAGQLDHPSLARATSNLQRWFPLVDWNVLP